jgi:hypothetical protein
MTGTSGRAIAIALAFFFFASTASATNPADVATARELYKKGADALDAHDPKLAADKLAQAWALVQTPVIGFDLARAQSALGHLVEAREAALSVQRLAIAHDETARSSEARRDAAKLATQLEPRIPHVLVDVRNLEGHDATVKLDGSVIPSAALSVARQANPGTHTAAVDTDDGRHAEGTIDLAERDTKTLTLTLDAPKAQLVMPPAKAQPQPAAKVEPANVPPGAIVDPPHRDASPSPLVWVGVVTIGVGLVAGGVTGAFAFTEANTVKNDCLTKIDGTFVCGPNDTGHLSAANALGTISTVGFVVAGVGVGVLVTGLILGPSKSHAKAATFTPFIGPVSGVAGTF